MYLNDAFFFFKQKTAYEMRISDLSSDVCSSDLVVTKKAEACRDTQQVNKFIFFFLNIAKYPVGSQRPEEHIQDIRLEQEMQSQEGGKNKSQEKNEQRERKSVV